MIVLFSCFILGVNVKIMLQNVYEAQCCQDIKKCIEELQSDEVLQDVETPPLRNHVGPLLAL